MVSLQKLEIELQELFKQKQYSKVIFEITSLTEDEERSSSLCNLLGLSRISNDRKNKDSLSMALRDFKQEGFTDDQIQEAIDGGYIDDLYKKMF